MPLHSFQLLHLLQQSDTNRTNMPLPVLCCHETMELTHINLQYIEYHTHLLVLQLAWRYNIQLNFANPYNRPMIAM